MSEISKTGSLDSSLILRQYKLDLTARLIEIKTMNPKLTQNEIAKQLGYPSATVKRYRNDVDMPSPHRTQTNTNKRKQKLSKDISNNQHEPKVNSNEPRRAQKNSLYLKQKQNQIRKTEIF